MKLPETIKLGSFIGKYLLGKETEEETGFIKSSLNENPGYHKIFQELKDKKQIGSAIEAFENFNKDLAWQRYMARVSALSFKKVLLRWQIAAIFFFIVGISGVVAFLNVETFNMETAGKLDTTVTTPPGQNSKIVLPDSSVVWLNSGTTLTYNNKFSIENREIKLEGQAFFEVERNEKIPLVVHCNDLEVRVLGTKFDVSAYPEDRDIRVVLESGKVELNQENNNSFDHILRPGEKAEFNTYSKELAISKVDTYQYTSWKDGILIFKNDRMDEVLEKLKRWYNIDIEVKDPKVYELVFNATIVNESVEEIFDLIKYTCSVNYEIIHSKSPEIPEKIIITN